MTEKTITPLAKQAETDGGGAASHTHTGDFQERFLRRPDVCQLTTLPSSTLTDYIKTGIFPKPYKLTAHQSNKHGSSVWKWSEVLAWMNSRQQAG